MGINTPTFEIIDWQTLEPDGRTWKPFAFEGMIKASAALVRIGLPAAGSLVRLIVREEEFRGPLPDLLLRAIAADIVARIEKAARPSKDIRTIISYVIGAKGMAGLPGRGRKGASMLMRAIGIDP